MIPSKQLALVFEPLPPPPAPTPEPEPPQRNPPRRIMTEEHRQAIIAAQAARDARRHKPRTS